MGNHQYDFLIAPIMTLHGWKYSVPFDYDTHGGMYARYVHPIYGIIEIDLQMGDFLFQPRFELEWGVYLVPFLHSLYKTVLEIGGLIAE